MPIKLQKLPAAVRWGLAVLCAAVCGVLWTYYWRVFFGLDNRVAPLVVTLGCAAFLEVCLLAGYCVRRFAKEFAASEFEIYRVMQDTLYQSEFDRVVQGLENKEE